MSNQKEENLNQAIEQITNAINAISILKIKASEFQKELNFYSQNEKTFIHNLGLLMRLSDEVQFLCIDVYSLHEGITKKKSLYSKVIKQNGKILSQIDRTDKINLIDAGIYDSDSGKMIEFSSEEIEALKQSFQKEKYRNRQEIRNNFGITSSNHADLDQWLDKMIDHESVANLAKYRKEFAHRLDSLENLQKVKTFIATDFIGKVLDIITKVLKSYELYLSKILVYRKSNQHLGVLGLKYESLSREMLRRENK